MAKGKKTGGRIKGVPNKTSGAVKDMILQALDESGGVEYLKARALDSPNAFLSLIGRILPMQVTGENGGPVAIRLERVIIDPAHPPGNGESIPPAP